MPYDRLSPQDSVFLHLEDDHQPLHVGSLAYFEAAPFLGADGRFDLDRVRRRIESRLHLVPRFRKRIMTVPFDQGRPIWVDDQDFDLAYHVRLTAIPAPGAEAQVKLLMDRLQAQMLDRRRPLWEIWLVEGVDADRVALIQKTHHALVDGVSGVDVATVLLDLEPDVVDAEALPWEPEPAPDATNLLIDSLIARASEPAELVRSARAALRVPGYAVERLGQVARTVADLSQRAPAAPWNVPVTPHRRFEPARIDLDRAKVLRRAAAQRGQDLATTTLNDVVLAACAGALRTYLLRRGDEAPDGLIYRAMVPVSVRDASEEMALGNRVSMMTADLPVGDPDAIERLRFVHTHMATRKDMGTAVGAEAIMELTGYAPPTLLALGSRLAVRTMGLNTVITNIPGPQVPLYCMGARMLEAFPYVCVVDGLAMIMAVISYDGKLAFGLSGDRSAVPDLHLLAEAVETAFDDLEAALGVEADTTGESAVVADRDADAGEMATVEAAPPEAAREPETATEPDTATGAAQGLAALTQAISAGGEDADPVLSATGGRPEASAERTGTATTPSETAVQEVTAKKTTARKVTAKKAAAKKAAKRATVKAATGTTSVRAEKAGGSAKAGTGAGPAAEPPLSSSDGESGSSGTSSTDEAAAKKASLRTAAAKKATAKKATAKKATAKKATAGTRSARAKKAGGSAKAGTGAGPAAKPPLTSSDDELGPSSARANGDGRS